MEALYVEVRYEFQRPGDREAFLQAVAPIAARTREEPGNARYEYLLPLTDPNALVLLEQWESAEAQRLHTTTPVYQQLAALKKELGVVTRLTAFPIRA